jgi:hypothetical protein
MGTAFWNGSNGDGFFKWVGWERLFQLDWLKTAFSNELNENVFFEWNRFVLVSGHSASYARSQFRNAHEMCCLHSESDLARSVSNSDKRWYLTWRKEGRKMRRNMNRVRI